MLNKKIFGSWLPFLVVLIGLFFTGFISFLLAPNPNSIKIESTKNKVQGINKTINVSTAEAKPKIKIVSYSIQNPTPFTQVPSPTPSITQTTNFSDTPISETSQITSPSTIPLPTTQIIQVNLSINASSSFAVFVSEGANQCDVLSKALADGKISSLNMRYDSNFETFAVYQINGLGKENSVWWTYLVNGQSPNQGCSFIKVKNNDSVEWRYIGS